MKETLGLIKESYIDIWKKKKELLTFSIIILILDIFSNFTNIENKNLYYCIHIIYILIYMCISIKITEIFLEKKLKLTTKIFFKYTFNSILSIIIPILFTSILYIGLSYIILNDSSETELIQNILLSILFFFFTNLLTRISLISVNLIYSKKLEIKKTLSLTKNQKLNLFIFTIFIYIPILSNRWIDNNLLSEIIDIISILLLTSFHVKYYKNRVSYQ